MGNEKVKFKNKKEVFRIILTLTAILVILLLQGVLFWGIGNLVIAIFKANYTWTFIHGMLSGMIVSLIMSFFVDYDELKL